MAEGHYRGSLCYGKSVSTAAMLHLYVDIKLCGARICAQRRMDDVIQTTRVGEDIYMLRTPGAEHGANKQAAAAYPPTLSDELPHWRRPDGSVSDW